MGLWEIIKGEQPGLFTTLKNYENAGQFGEFATEYALDSMLTTDLYMVLKNLYVPYRGKTSEIDLVMVHEKGIFVFESKNYSGWIFGSADQPYWTQSLQNGDKNRFYNPILQNKTHIKALAEYLQLPETAFSSYIIFSERCELKKVPEDTQQYVIVRRPRMLKKLRADLKDRQSIYTLEQLQAMCKKLNALAQVSDEDKQQHIEDIKTKCPLCGAQLVLRNGKYGSFWGCSSYPKCRYTRREE